MSKKKKEHGGARLGAGRPRLNPKGLGHREGWGYITCQLREDTIQKLRSGAAKVKGGEYRFFGKYLQDHLDRHPLPTWDEYQAIKHHRPLLAGRRRVPVIIATKDPIKLVDHVAAAVVPSRSMKKLVNQALDGLRQ